MPRIGIGLPVYNGERFVGEAIASILRQTFTDFELIISDNGSTDNTAEICRDYASRDQRIRFYPSAENRGAVWNFRRVFHLSNAPYFKWAAHDDLCAPEHLERCIEILDRYPSIVLAYTKNCTIDEQGAVIGEHFDGFDLRSPAPHERFLQCLATIGRCNPMFGVVRAPEMAKAGLLANYVASDYVLLVRLALQGQFYEVPERLFLNRDHSARSGRACHGLQEHLLWCDPKNRGPAVRWARLLVEYFRAIWSTPMSLVEKARCYFVLLRWLHWNWKVIAGELARVVWQTPAWILMSGKRWILARSM